MDNATFFNAYVDNLLKELAELNRQRIMMKTQLDVLNALSAAQAERIKELEASSLDKPEPPADDEEKEF